MSSEDPQRRQEAFTSTNLLEEINCTPSIICDDLLSLGDGDEDEDLSEVGELRGFFESVNDQGLFFQRLSYAKSLVPAASPSPPIHLPVSPYSEISKTTEVKLCKDATPAASSIPPKINLIGRFNDKYSGKRAFVDRISPRDNLAISQPNESSLEGLPSGKLSQVLPRRNNHNLDSDIPKQLNKLKRKGSVIERCKQHPSPVARKRHCVAATQGKAPTLRFHLKAENYTNPLNAAIQRGAPAGVLQKLVDQFPSVLCVTDGHQKETSLHVLLKHAPADCATVDRMLLAKPNCVSILDRHFNTPLHVACGYGACLDVVRHLYILYPEALEMRNFHGKTPLEVALGGGCCDNIVDFLNSKVSLQHENKTYNFE